jgi:hypothetical protein
MTSATAEVLDAYADSLRWLVGAVDRGLTGAVDSRRASADFARFRESGAPDFLNTIEHYADLNLQASDELERRYFRDGMALPESAAPLLGGYLLAAKSLAAALHLEPEMLSTTTPQGNQLDWIQPEVSALVAEDGEVEEVNEVVVALRELQQRGGADTTTAADAAIDHIVDGLVSSTNTIATSSFARPVTLEYAEWIRQFLGYFPAIETAIQNLGRIRRQLFKFLAKAVNIVRRYLLGRPEDVSPNDVEEWVKDKVVEFIQHCETGFVKKVLKTKKLSAACNEKLRKASNPAALEQKLTPILLDYDKWAKWGRGGAKVISYIPTTLIAGMLGPSAPVVLGVIILALVAYEFWTAADHLDYPKWPLVNIRPGVAGIFKI